MTSAKATINGPTILFRGGVFALFWWLITDGAMSSWLVGLPTVALAIIASISFLPQMTIAWAAVPRFLLFFLVHSLRGGFDVAWRAFHPKMPIYPDVIEYPLQLPHELAQVLMTNMVSLLPGTLGAVLERGILKVHVLDRKSDFRAELALLEENVGRLFGASIAYNGGQSQ